MPYSRPMEGRRFPSLWSVEEMDVCFIVRDLNEQVLAYFSTRR